MKKDFLNYKRYTKEEINQRATMLLKNVKYGIEFHFELTGLKCDEEDNSDEKHYNIIKRKKLVIIGILFD